MNDQTAAILKHLGPSGNMIGRLFQFMSITEDAIAAAIVMGQITHEQGARVFKHACPSMPLRSKIDQLYRKHVEELIRRASKNWTDAQMCEGTDAEALGALLDMATKAPLTRNALAATERLMIQLFPRDADRIIPKNERTPEAWPGQAFEDITALRRQLRRPEAP